MSDKEWRAEKERKRDEAEQRRASATNPKEERRWRAARDNFQRQLTMGRGGLSDAALKARDTRLGGTQRVERAMFFAYHIVPEGGHAGQALERGTCTAPNVEAAKRHVQTVPAPNVAGKSGLEVILQDSAGAEIWRGRYTGSG